MRVANRALVSNQPLVAVFIGGTSGIGEYTACALGKGLRLYIVGRNERSAKRIIRECQRVCSGGHFQFVAVQDLTLLKEVDRVCADIIKTEKTNAAAKLIGGESARIDMLFMTQGKVDFTGRTGKFIQ